MPHSPSAGGVKSKGKVWRGMRTFPAGVVDKPLKIFKIDFVKMLFWSYFRAYVNV